VPAGTPPPRRRRKLRLERKSLVLDVEWRRAGGRLSIWEVRGEEKVLRQTCCNLDVLVWIKVCI